MYDRRYRQPNRDLPIDHRPQNPGDQIGNTALMRLLLDAGAETDFQNKQGQSALIRATIAGQRDAVALLLAVNADTRLVDRNHKTARDWAKETGHIKSLALLDERRNR